MAVARNQADALRVGAAAPRELELTLLGQEPAEEIAPTATLTPTAPVTPAVTPTTTLPVDPAVTPTLTPTLTPAPAPALALAKTAAPAAAEPGQLVTLTLVASNDGTAEATGLLVRDSLPKGLAYLPDSAPGAKYDPAAATLTWSLAEPRNRLWRKSAGGSHC